MLLQYCISKSFKDTRAKFGAAITDPSDKLFIAFWGIFTSTYIRYIDGKFIKLFLNAFVFMIEI